MKIRRWLAAFLACVLVFNIFPFSAFAVNPDFIIAGEDTEVEIGKQASVNINLSNNPGFSVLNLYYTYDETYFTLKNVENKAWPLLNMLHEKTTVWDAKVDYQADGTLATLVFDVAENTPVGSYEIGIHLISAANSALEYVTPVMVNATITVTQTKVKGVEIYNPDVSLDVGATEQLIAKVTPDDAADKSVTWYSMDKSVATVDQNGVVTGVAYGTTEIIVTTNDGGYTDRCKVSVNCAHSYGSKVFAPTYKEHGYTLYTCTICGYSYSDHFVAPLEQTPIEQADISLEYTEAFYEGKPLEPEVYISYQGQKLDAATELKITYGTNGQVGVATVTVEGINRFTGTLTLTFTVTYEVIPEPIVNVSAISDYGKILLSWGRSNEVATDAYRIYRAAEGEDTYTLVEVIYGRDNVTYTDISVKKGVSYTYYVTGVGAYGAESEPSVIAGATALVDQKPPVVLKIDPAENLILSGTVTFTAVAQDDVGVHSGYYEYSLDGEHWTEIGTTYDKGLPIRFTVDFDTDITVLQLRLTVYDAEGNASEPKIAKYVIDNVGPDKVTGLEATALSSKLTLSWNDVAATDAQYFILEQQIDSGWTTVATNITTLGYTITNLTPGTTYAYRVACVDLRGNVGEYSDVFNATTAADTTAPVITNQGPASARYNKEITFYATARDDSDIQYIYIEVSTDLIHWERVDTKQFDAAASLREYTSKIDLADRAEGSLYVRAIAQDFAGNLSNTDASAPYSEYIVDKTAPTAPENVTVNGKNGYISIFWTMGKESDINTYTVYRSLSENGEFVPVSSPLTAVSYHDTAVEDGITYFYKVAVSDRAGNISEYSAVVSAAMTADTQKPEITGFTTTANQKFGPHRTTISVSAADNNKLSCLLVEYCTTQDLEYRELLLVENIAASYVTTQVELPLDGLTDDDVVHIRVSAKDMAGLSSGYVMSKFTFDSTAPTVTDLSAVIRDNKTTLTWNSGKEADLSGFKVYRSTDGVNFTLLGSRGQNTSGSYTFIDTITAKESATYTYKVEAVDVLQNAASQTVVVEYVYVYENTPPTAVISAPAYMMEGSEERFDASGSTDDLAIERYHWDFGDGTTSNEKKPVKKYTAAGTYEITLTVTDNGGLTSTDTLTMVVDKQDTLGLLHVAVLDENNNPVPYVPVYFDLGSENQRIVNTNGDGIATLKMSQGTHVVGMYATGYLPVKKDVVVLQNATRTVTLTTVKEELVTGKFEVTRMTFEEIVAAGIDVYDPANRNVYSATVRVSYGSTPPISVSYVRNDTKILDYKIYDYSGEPIEDYVNENGEIRHFAGVQYIGGDHELGGGGVGGEQTDIIAIIDIPAEASYLKEFFDVKLHIINNASPAFSLERNTVTLNVPEGMTLMESVTGGYLTSSTVEIDSIQGQQTKTLAWVLRGDKAGEYDLSADFTGTLSDFNALVTTRFETDTPIKVYGLEGVKFRVLSATEIHNETLYFNIELENQRDIDIYAPAAGLAGKVKNVTESVLNQSPKDDFYVQSNILNVYIANENGAKQYIPFTLDANNNPIVKVDVLAPGQKIVYEYVAYNAADYDGIGYFKDAMLMEFEGLVENIEFGSFEKQRYSFIDYSEKLDAILSGADNETVRGYQHILDSDDYYYASATGGYFAEQCEKMYKAASLILTFDFGVLTQEEERQMIQAIILTILSDSSVISQSEDLLMAKYTDAITGMIDVIKDGMLSTLGDSESSVKDISDVCASILKDKRELAIIYRTEGREAFLAKLNDYLVAYAFGIGVDMVDYLSVDAETACFSDVFGDLKDVVGAFFEAVSETDREAYYYAVLKKQCNSEISTAILYALRDILLEQLQGELLEAIGKGILAPGATLVSLPDVGLGANVLAYQTVELMITQLENDLDTFYEDVNLYVNLLGELGEVAASKVLQKVFATAIGSTTFGIISAAFTITDAVFGFGDYVKQQDTFDIYKTLSDVFLQAHLNSIRDRGEKSDFYSMLYLRALCEMRLSGEAQYKKFMSDYIDGVYLRPIDEDIVLFYINLVKRTNYSSYDQWGDDLQYSVVRPRDLIFNIEFTEVNIPRAPVVTLNYETLQTEQSFTSDYEYCFADGKWKDCDGNPISFAVGEVPSVIRVRKAAGDDHLAGEITTVKIFAQKELSKLIKVKFDGVNYILEGLSSEYHYQILFVEDPDAQLDWTKAKVISGADNVIKGAGKTEYAVIRSCQNAAKNETVSLPLPVAVASKAPLDLVIQGSGMVSQSGVNGCYYNGENIDLIATPNAGVEFIGWFDENNKRLSEDRHYIVEMAEDQQIIARFGGKTISSVEITNLPKKITYYEGESLDLNGLELTVNYTDVAPVMYKLRSTPTRNTDGSQSIADQYTAYLASNEAGKTVVMINYGGQTTSYEIEILHSTIEYVQKEATCGEDGAHVVYCTLCQEIIESTPIPATGDHHYEWIVDQEETCGEPGVRHEECTVCHAKRNENTSIPATGNHTYDDVYDTACNGCDHIRQTQSISVSTVPEKTEYLEARETLDVTGGVITLTYDDGVFYTVNMTEDMVSGFDNTVTGPQTLTVTYNGKTTTFVVTIKQKSLVSIAVTTAPTKSEYLEGKDELDLAGGKLTLTYDNESTEEINLSEAEVTGFDNTVTGPQTLTVTYNGKTTTFVVTIKQKSLVSIAVTTAPTKTEYLEGKDELDLAGGKLTLTYDNESTEEIDLSEAEVTGFDNTVTGPQTLTVTYNGKTTTFVVTIKQKSLVSIAVTTAPTKTEYLEGKDELDLAGGKLTLTYDNESTEEIDLSEAEVTDFDNTVTGPQTLTVTYNNKSTSFDVAIIAKTLTHIEVTTLPAKLQYIEGNVFDSTGMVVTAFYNNDTSEVITEYAVSGYDPTIGEKTIKVTYEGVEDTFQVTVREKRLTAIEVVKDPTKTEYLEVKDDLDLTGGKLKLFYDNETNEEIDLSEAEVTGFDNTVTGPQELTVTYNGKSTTLQVKVIAKTLTRIEVTTLPTKTEYIEGNAFDSTGMVVTAFYNNDTSEVITAYAVSGYENTPGEKTITVTHEGKEDTFKVTVAVKSLTGIEVTTLPTELKYIESTALDETGMVLTLHYNNDTSETLTTGWESTYDFSEVGTATVTVTYGGKTTTYKVTVVAKTLTHIAVTTLPTKTEYIEGNAFDSTGMVVTAFYNNDTSEVITEYAVSGYEPTIGEKTIKVTYEGMEDTFRVTVREKRLVSIAVTTAPTKTEYLEGKDELDLAGGKLTLTYDNESTEEIDLSEAEVTGFDNTETGPQTLTVTYNNKSTSFDVAIIAKTLTHIEVTTLPTKLQYIEGNVFDSTGMVVTAFYNNDTSEVITEYAVSGYEPTIGEKTIKVTYEGVEDTFRVTVREKRLVSIAVTTAPTKTEYLEMKDILDLTGGKLTLYYDNGTGEEIDLSEAEVTGFSNQTVGEITLTVAYSGKTTTFTVDIIAKRVAYIEVTAKPNKLTYLEGDAFNSTGMVITAYYNNDTSAVVTGYDVSGYASTPGTKTVTVSYEGKSASFEVTVRAKSVVSVELTTKPSKLTYVEHTSLDDTGMVLTVYYDNNTHATLTSGWTSAYDFSQIGATTVTVTYGGQSVAYDVTVVAKSLSHITVVNKPTKRTYLEGEELDLDGLVIRARYNNGSYELVGNYSVTGYESTPGTKTITVTYEGKSATFTVTVKSRVPSTITSSQYTVSGENISKITTGTTVSSLLTGIGEQEFCKVYKGDAQVSGNTPIGTGMVVKIMDGNTVKVSYTVIVTGDTNGDGNTTITDMIAVKAHVLKKSLLSGAYAAAANTNGDSGISITDFIQIKAKILGKGNIIAR